jgi:hypothetical protein
MASRYDACSATGDPAYCRKDSAVPGALTASDRRKPVRVSLVVRIPSRRTAPPNNRVNSLRVRRALLRTPPW